MKTSLLTKLIFLLKKRIYFDKNNQENYLVSLKSKDYREKFF